MGKKRREPIQNEDKVIAHTTDQKIFPWKMGALKQAFLSKQLPYEVTFVYHIKSNTNYNITYAPTKGFNYTKKEA